MKMKPTLLLIIFLFTPFIALADTDYTYVSNGTSCLVGPDLKVSYVKPVTAYAFDCSKTGSCSYTGISDAPGQKDVKFPMYRPSSSLAVLTFFTGASPGDAVPHIIGCSPTDPGQHFFLVQTYDTSPAGYACTKAYPCVACPTAGTEQKCVTLLAEHSMMHTL